MICADCQSNPAIEGGAKCYECRDFQLRINSERRFYGWHQCPLCGEQNKGNYQLCADCRGRGAYVERDHSVRKVR